MPIEKSSAMEAGDAAQSAEESQAKVASASIEDMKRQAEEGIGAAQDAATEEERKRQEEADMADFKRQLHAVNEAKASARTYTVEPGDSLSAIAKSVYGDGGRWPEIFEANKDQLSDPNLIQPGQVLRIP